VLFKNPKLIWPFEDPVDPVSLNIPDYPLIVKNPMDIGTIRKRLHEGYYNENIEDFVKDIRRIFMNAVTYNDPYHQIHKLAIQCSNIFEKKLDKSKPIIPALPLCLGRSNR
jgi:Transcription factor involved in chromatin remodeling, contains bromodomain